MRATNRDVRLCNLQDLIYMAADRAMRAEDWGMYRHQMDRYDRVKGGGEQRVSAWEALMGRFAFPERYLNPLSAVDVARYGQMLRGLLLSLDRQVVGAAFIGEGERDLLGTVGEEVHGIREFLDRWIGVAPEPADLTGRGLAVLDSFEDELLAAAEHGGLPVVAVSKNVPEGRG